MNRYSWNETANGLAQQVRQNFAFVKRGVVPLRFIDDSTVPPHFVDDAPLVMGVFGNDNYLWDEQTRREVELVREQLRETEVQEMGFGLSEDGYSWALLIGADKEQYETRAGKALQKELMKASLEQTIWNAWRKAYGIPAEELGQAPAASAPQGGILTV